MYKYLFTTLSFFIFSISTFSQVSKVTIAGCVKDTSGQNLQKATIMLLSTADSTLLNFTVSNEKGFFEFKNIKNQPVLLKISYIGFIPYQQKIGPFATEKNTLADPILKPISQELMEVVIRDAKAALSIRGDTIEYNPASFKVPPGSTVEDLLRRLPGIDLDAEGNISTQGQNVKRVLVDGKTFFGDNPKFAIKNLGAETISKVQLYNGKSDQAQSTGINDGKQEKTINLELKDKFKTGKFGKIAIGQGDENRRFVQGNFNKFNKKEQLSFILFGNNINQTGLNREDLQEFTGRNTFENQDNGNFGFTDLSDYRNYQSSNVLLSDLNNKGFSENFGGGVNYNYDTKKVKLSSSYTYNQTDNLIDQFVNRNTFQKDQFFTTSDTSQSNTFVSNHVFSARLENNIDSSNRLVTKLNFKIVNNNYKGSNYSETILNSKELTNTKESQTNNLNTSHNLNLISIYRYKFNKKGRIIALSGLLTKQNYDATKQYESRYVFLNAISPTERLRAVLQNEEDNSDNLTFGAGMSYTEPITKKITLENFYNFKKDTKVGDNDVMGPDKNVYDSISSFTNNGLMYNRIGASLRYAYKGINISVGLAALQYDLNSQVANQESASAARSLSKKYNAITPNFSASIELKNDLRFNLGYAKKIRTPDFFDLIRVINNSNLFYQFIPNPNLDANRSHDFSMSMNKFSKANFSYLGINASYEMFTNDISSKRSITLNNDKSQLTISTPYNVKGTANTSLSIYTGMPIVKTKLTTNISASIFNTKRIAEINNQENNTINNNYSLSNSYNFTPSSSFNLNFSVRYSITDIKYSLIKNQNQAVKNWTVNLVSNYNMGKKYFFETSFNYTKLENTLTKFNREIPVLNASIRKLLLKENRLEVVVSAFDIFNKRKNITQNGSGNEFYTISSYTLARYFMLKLVYNLRGHDEKIKNKNYMGF